MKPTTEILPYWGRGTAAPLRAVVEGRAAHEACGV